MKKIMERLVPVAEEIGVDATYNTNQSNMELVSVLAQHDGVGFPVAYMLMTATNEIKPHAKTAALESFLCHLRDAGLSPKVVFTDKVCEHILLAYGAERNEN